MRAKLMTKIGSAGYMSFTTDTWTTSQCTDSLLSVTAHWNGEDWKWQWAVVAACPMEGSHTADNIKEVIKGILTSWKVSGRVHVFLRDNDINVSNGLRDAGVRSLGCFAHTLQLCVKKALTSQRAANDALACSHHSFFAFGVGEGEIGKHPAGDSQPTEPFE